MFWTAETVQMRNLLLSWNIIRFVAPGLSLQLINHVFVMP